MTGKRRHRPAVERSNDNRYAGKKISEVVIDLDSRMEFQERALGITTEQLNTLLDHVSKWSGMIAGQDNAQKQAGLFAQSLSDRITTAERNDQEQMNVTLSVCRRLDALELNQPSYPRIKDVCVLLRRPTGLALLNVEGFSFKDGKMEVITTLRDTTADDVDRLMKGRP